MISGFISLIFELCTIELD